MGDEFVAVLVHVQESPERTIADLIFGARIHQRALAAGKRRLLVLVFEEILSDAGVSIAGFAVMSAKIDGVKRAVHGLADQMETVSAKIDSLQRDAIDVDFAELKSLAKSFDEAWQLGDDAAARRWQDVARGALSQQSRFELRADRVLNSGTHHYVEADPFMDAVNLATALRVAALAACNESLDHVDRELGSSRCGEYL